MVDRNTGIRSSQIKNLTIQAEDLNTDAVETAKIKDGNVTGIKLNADVVDDFTMKLSNNQLKIADRIELNTMLNAFRIAINGGLTQFGMVDGITDEYEDESGIDTGASTNEDYDEANDLYKPDETVALELDYMEYASDEAAQAAYVSSDAGSEAALITHDVSVIMIDVGDNGGTEYRYAQSFTLASAITMTKVSLSFAATVGTPTGNFTVRIETDAAGVPSGSLTHANATKAITPTASQWNDFDFTDFPLAAGYYWIVAVVDDQANNNYWQWWGQGGGSTYPGGMRGESIDGGSTWEAQDSIDMAFKIYGIIPNLQSYSENSIINQGTYSLKAVAAITDSLNDTLTKSGLSLDLTDKDTLKLWAYASRTGTNLQIQIHDSGGQTSTKDIIISSADTWTEITWDISGISNANKDDIDSIIIKIINADSANTFYVDNFDAPGIINNMTLISNSETAEAQPDTARIVIFEEDVDSITVNTDLKAYITRDGGTTYSQVTLADEGDYGSGKRILTGIVDISGQPAGTSMEYKIETLNNKSLKLHGVGELWD